ncbi:LysM peptidoglycan-binding domain-containing protein [Anaerobacillus sp. MEB173]|uniref:LysM peptidoglycan-binding domain-containing protein n=1 Tax=Anaerobacillus sp. MEB173 TaxID=3383345 RepID=UPI003F93F56F
MLHVVQNGDTLGGIAASYGTSIGAIMNANVICNPNLIFPGQPLIIPQAGIDLPRAGGYPYYVVLYGDTLWCIANQFSQSVASLAAANQIRNPNQIYAGSELLVLFEPPNPQELFDEWNRMGGVQCEEMSSLQVHGIYYIGSFRWETLGERAIPYLTDLLRHSCDTVRYYTVLSLGRIGTGMQTRLALQQALNDEVPYIAELARFALQRYQLIPVWTKRIHIITSNTILLNQPTSSSPSHPISKGTPVIVQRWNIPSPTGEEGPRGDIQMFDLVQITGTGQIGYLPRVGFNEIVMV